MLRSLGPHDPDTAQSCGCSPTACQQGPSASLQQGMPSCGGGVDLHHRDALRPWGPDPLAVHGNYDASCYPGQGAAHLQPPWQPGAARPGQVSRCPAAFMAPAAGAAWGSTVYPRPQGIYPQMAPSHSACYQPSACHAAPHQQWTDGPRHRHGGADQHSCQTQQPAEPFAQSACSRTRRGPSRGRDKDLSNQPTDSQFQQQFQQQHSSYGQLWPAPPAKPGHAASGTACSSSSSSTQLASLDSAGGSSICRQGSKPDAAGGDQALRPEPCRHLQKQKQHTASQHPQQPEQQPQQPAARKGPLSHRQRYRRKLYALHKAMEEQAELQRQQVKEQAALLATAAQFSLAANQAKATAQQEGTRAAAAQEEAGLSQGPATDCSSPLQEKAGRHEHKDGTATLAAQLTCMHLAPGKSEQQVAANSKPWKLPDSLFDDDDAPATKDASSSWRIPAVPAGGMIRRAGPGAWQLSPEWCSVGCHEAQAGAEAEAEVDCSDTDQQLDEIDHHLTQLLGL